MDSAVHEKAYIAAKVFLEAVNVDRPLVWRASVDSPEMKKNQCFLLNFYQNELGAMLLQRNKNRLYILYWPWERKEDNSLSYLYVGVISRCA